MHESANFKYRYSGVVLGEGPTNLSSCTVSSQETLQPITSPPHLLFHSILIFLEGEEDCGLPWCQLAGVGSI